ncbi:Zinc finger CCCH domain-containing protein 59 [Symbiodinium microadriaticum]|uniref:Zinc finger CCCH domain-containing protein 59 n=1 Tax=Symbiodinium microadriaticum TaxID=2951 RepID=A0A1Q9F4D6_SYMMI|nr:Zinc finger CCCH domain-containing protein 59 [Symbiodinium microadriaticum]
MTKAEQKKAVQFTRMCKFWQTNECKMGADCTFAHDSSDLRPSPKPCFDFAKKGVCTRGDACRFVHQLGPKAKVKVTEMHNATFQMIRPDIPSQLTMPVQTLGAPRKFALNSAAAPWFPRESDAVLNQFPQAPPGLDQIPLPKSLIGGMPTDGKDEADVCSTSSGDSSLGFQGGALHREIQRCILGLKMPWRRFIFQQQEPLPQQATNTGHGRYSGWCDNEPNFGGPSAALKEAAAMQFRTTYKEFHDTGYCQPRVRPATAKRRPDRYREPEYRRLYEVTLYKTDAQQTDFKPASLKTFIAPPKIGFEAAGLPKRSCDPRRS